MEVKTQIVDDELTPTAEVAASVGALVGGLVERNRHVVKEPCPKCSGFYPIKDGNCMWCDADRTAQIPRPKLMRFSEALEAAEDQGVRIARDGWNGKGMFVYYVPGGVYPTQTRAAKLCFGDSVEYGPYLAMKTVQGIVVPWLASQTDIVAKDWVIID
jgi:hypothetical protein